jgi:hypothetical protein
MLIGSWAMIGVATSSVWAQEAAKPEPVSGNPPFWPLALVGFVAVYFILLMVYVLRRQKFQKGLVDRSLKLSEERNELARQQLAMQAETNRLLERLIAERGEA